MITSVSSKLRKTIKPVGTKPATDEETLVRKKGFLEILDIACDDFNKKLKKGEVKLNSTIDLERLVKLTLLVSGEAESIKGQSSTEEQDSVSDSLTVANIERVLKPDDPLVKSIYDRLLEGYNTANDEAGKD